MGQSSTSAIESRALMLTTHCMCEGGPSSLSHSQSWHSLLPLSGPLPLPQHLHWAVSNFLPSPHPPSFYPSCSGLGCSSSYTVQSERAREGGWAVLNPSAFSICTLHPLTPTPDPAEVDRPDGPKLCSCDPIPPFPEPLSSWWKPKCRNWRPGWKR